MAEVVLTLFVQLTTNLFLRLKMSFVTTLVGTATCFEVWHSSRGVFVHLPKPYPWCGLPRRTCSNLIFLSTQLAWWIADIFSSCSLYVLLEKLATRARSGCFSWVMETRNDIAGWFLVLYDYRVSNWLVVVPKWLPMLWCGRCQKIYHCCAHVCLKEYPLVNLFLLFISY